MNDPNVLKYPIYATARTAEEFQDAFRDPHTGISGFRSAAEIVAEQKRDHEDYLINGQTFYDWRMKPIVDWLNAWMAPRGLTLANRNDYQKTEIIRWIAEEGDLEELIGLWRPNFKFTENNCLQRAEAVNFLMIAMDFRLFKIVDIDLSGTYHVTNAYWDDYERVMRFIDVDFGWDVWNLMIDELAERNFLLQW